MSHHSYDVVVAGAGIGGLSSAVAAARTGAKTLLIEPNARLGGTGVYSPLGIVCGLGPRHDFWVNEGILKDFFPHLWSEPRYPEMLPYYDSHELADRYEKVAKGEGNLEVWTASAVDTVKTTSAPDGRRIEKVGIRGNRTGEVSGAVFIDGTANGDLSAMAGAEFQKGRACDGKLQPCTLTFTVRNIRTELLGLGDSFVIWTNREKKVYATALGLDAEWNRLKKEGKTSNPKEQDWVLFFPSRDGRTIVFNHTRVVDIDPTVPGDIERGRKLAEQQIWEYWNAVRHHPTLRDAVLEIAPQLGVREGRRIIGDYILTQNDCLGEARFADMVAAAAYSIDIHDPEGGGTQLLEIPGSGYYHIPYRCLRAKDWKNLLLGSRCLSGTHEAHSSYRVMAPLSAVGHACGVAAALTVLQKKSDVREIPAEQIRCVLQAQGQFTEGPMARPPGK